MTALLDAPDLLEDATRLWHGGDLSWLCRPGGQEILYDFVHGCADKGGDTVSPIVLECHRRLGKSFVLLLLLVERALQRPGQQLVYGAPTYEQVATIVVPNMAILLQTCPESLRPKRSDYTWTFRNPTWPQGSPPSVLRAVGVDYMRGDRLRGACADAVALDEVRDMSEPRYLVEDVLLYQFVGRESPWIAMGTTPPRSGDHEVTAYFAPRAVRDGRYRKIPVTENAYWTETEERRLLEAIGGGKESISWRREALCETVGDENELIVPEFQRNELAVVVKEYPRPEYFYPHTCLDTGWNDWNAALEGYVDFKNQTLVIEDEIVMRYQSTGTIAAEINRKEAELWLVGGRWAGGKRPTRMGDLTEQALEDLRTDHKVSINPVVKYDREAAIANLRTSIQNGKVKIFERCKNLIYQLRNGIWNEARTQFERSERLGHCDALAACVYFHRMANWNGNPFPDTPVQTDSDHVINLRLARRSMRSEELKRAICR